MTGWQRLKLVLSVIYWGFALLLGYIGGRGGAGFEWPMFLFVVGAAAVFYAIAALIWWAFAAFPKQR